METKKTTKTTKGGRNESAPKKRTSVKSVQGKKPYLRDDQIIEALKNSGGFVSMAAVLLGVTTSAISHRINRSERIQQAKRDIEDSHLDIAESKLINKVKQEDLGAICFYLKCKGKGRGYVEKQQTEISGPGESKLKFNIEFVKPEDGRNDSNT